MLPERIYEKFLSYSLFCFVLFLDLQTLEDTTEHEFYIEETIASDFQGWKKILAKLKVSTAMGIFHPCPEISFTTWVK